MLPAMLCDLPVVLLIMFYCHLLPEWATGGDPIQSFKFKMRRLSGSPSLLNTAYVSKFRPFWILL